MTGVKLSMRLSPHFTLGEMIMSQVAARKGYDNMPSSQLIENLRFLCMKILEPLRQEFGPVYVSSGYRCPEVNLAIGGSSTSVHMLGLAADHVTPSVSLKDEMDWWISQTDIPWDQVILEYGRWIHVGAAREGMEPRHQALMIYRGTGYLPYSR